MITSWFQRHKNIKYSSLQTVVSTKYFMNTSRLKNKIFCMFRNIHVSITNHPPTSSGGGGSKSSVTARLKGGCRKPLLLAAAKKQLPHFLLFAFLWLFPDILLYGILYYISYCCYIISSCPKSFIPSALLFRVLITYLSLAYSFLSSTPFEMLIFGGIHTYVHNRHIPFLLLFLFLCICIMYLTFLIYWALTNRTTSFFGICV